jgi:hypothetical protein
MNLGLNLTLEELQTGKMLNLRAALRRAKEQGQPFVLAWRRQPDAQHPRWQVGDDAGCGCGPID